MEGTLQQSGPAFRRWIGLELSGPHSERSAVVVLDEYPQSQRLVLSQVLSGLGANEEKSSDDALIELLRALSSPSEGGRFEAMATQAPLSLPPFFKSSDDRPREERWLKELWARTKPRPRVFLPYLNRPLDVWMRYFTPERFQIPEAMGANLAPLAARIQALKSELPSPIFESYPRASFTRIVGGAGFSRYWPKLYSDAEQGLRVRDDFLERLLKIFPQIFAYQGDLETLVVDLPSFHAFMSALSLFLNDKGQCDPKPEHFPSSASWLLLPRQKVRWDALFE